MTPTLHHIPADPAIPWQWWGVPDNDAERDRAIRSAEAREPDRWEWVRLGGKQVVALYLAGFPAEASARAHGFRNGW